MSVFEERQDTSQQKERRKCGKGLIQEIWSIHGSELLQTSGLKEEKKRDYLSDPCQIHSVRLHKVQKVD